MYKGMRACVSVLVTHTIAITNTNTTTTTTTTNTTITSNITPYIQDGKHKIDFKVTQMMGLDDEEAEFGIVSTDTELFCEVMKEGQG